MKMWFASKTIWIGILQILISVLGAVATFLEAGDFTTPSCILFITGVLMILLRYITNEGIEL